ncbi:MAG: hypothetical protein JXA25_01655 [Anaerolineales bacterium]|nr:hypothetical protein [Anaerolineales bacterium]
MTSELDGKKTGSGKIVLWIIMGLVGASICCVLAFSAFTGGIVSVVFGAIRSSEVYELAMDRALNNPEVTDVLGEPVKAGFFVRGSVNVNGPSGEASLAIPLKGSISRGTLHVIASKTAGEWHFTILEVGFDDLPRRIDLLEP